ncbi:unnamed protein product (macronuclear) [Paramecium tetraurelia]|uniref:Protein kinase domain-containing protein n=1 Tax=Paramecium tetraurelia TaxID=5888 RepID=A0BTL2_PARTE|nr:uncharacterized protein GSPATT00032111001 [Paramecium tetraurelia]CAK61879.1 unnamed protein product [Paramecium tetraurelia]|eukprot:XP_001429277.1 hypothetical protein (macronuclear) [Paramecium tetraurelia strain d4-2]
MMNQKMMMRHNTNSSYEADNHKHYRITIGEMINDYKLINKCRMGVFANVCKAIKMDRNMLSNLSEQKISTLDLERERQILKQLNVADPNNIKHNLRLIESFEHRNIYLNLRNALKKYTKGQGINLQAIRSYAMQLLVAESHLRKQNIVYADISPDNILLSANTNC